MATVSQLSARRMRRRCIALNLGALLAVGSAAAWTIRQASSVTSLRTVAYPDWQMRFGVPVDWVALGETVDLSGTPLRGFASADGSAFLRLRHRPVRPDESPATLCCTILNQYALFLGTGVTDACQPEPARFLEQTAARAEMAAGGAGATLSVVVVAAVLVGEDGVRTGAILEMQVNGPYRRIHRRIWDRIRTSVTPLGAAATGFKVHAAPEQSRA